MLSEQWASSYESMSIRVGQQGTGLANIALGKGGRFLVNRFLVFRFGGSPVWGDGFAVLTWLMHGGFLNRR